ncbi:MAG: ABC transporter permease [Acidimicrobiia bacterium]
MTTATTNELAPVEVSSRFSLYWYVMDAARMTKRSVMHIIRSFDQVMSLVMFPIMFTVLFRYVNDGSIKLTDMSYVNFMFPGILVQTLAFGANYTTINIAVDLQNGIVDRFRSLPMYNSSFIIGHVIADLFRNFISSIIMLIVGFLVGFRPNVSFTETLSIIGIAILFTLAISSVSAVLGMMVNSLEAAQWIGFVFIFPLTFASSAFVEPARMKAKWLKAFAENQPFSHVINTIRGLFHGTPIHNNVGPAIIWCVALIAISIPLTAVMFRRKATK